MAGRPANASLSDLDRWLATLGFNRGNPFATAEADQERTLLPEFFVDVDGYERIKADRTIIVFAPRGGGKSALRVVLASQAAPLLPEATTLAVEYTDFNVLITKRHSGQHLMVDDHVPRLLRAGAKALLESLCGDPTAEQPAAVAASDRQRRRSRIAKVSAPARSRLALMLRVYDPTRLRPEALYEDLQLLNPAFAPLWSAFTEAAAGRRLHEFIARSSAYPQTDEIANLLADLNDCPDEAADAAATPIEQMGSFVRLAHAIGFSSVQFMLDRLDEHKDTANHPEAQADILEPLLADLPVLELPGVAFKFFLSREARDILLERPTIRRDRLVDQAVTVKWDQNRLKYLLDARLAVYSDGQVHDLVQLCRDMRVDVGRGQAPRPLGEWIEAEMLQLAQGSPRRLLVAAQLLCQAHMNSSTPTGLLERADWEKAKADLIDRMPPVLRLCRDSPTARVGEREVRLTALQHRILLTLVGARGRCDRDALIAGAWEAKGNVSDATIDQAIGRLRERLGDVSNNPAYIKTERGQGFELANYEFE